MMFGNDLLPEIYRKLSELLVFFYSILFRCSFSSHTEKRAEWISSHSSMATSSFLFSSSSTRSVVAERQKTSIAWLRAWMTMSAARGGEVKNFPTENIWQTWEWEARRDLSGFFGMKLKAMRQAVRACSSNTRKCSLDEINYSVELEH